MWWEFCLNSGYVYALVALVGVFQLVLILNRTVHTSYKESIDRDFTQLLHFFITFGIIDFLWGICNARPFFVNYIIFNIVTYGYHILCALSAFLWFGYMMKYLKISGTQRHVCNAFRGVFLSGQLIMIVVNVFTHGSFYMSVDLSYHSGPMRPLMYGAQFLYYVFILMLVAVLVSNSTDAEYNKRCKNVFIFSLVPLIFGIGQFMFYDVAMYSMGFMLSAFIIYAFTLTEIRETHLTRVAEDSRQNSFIDVLTSLLNRRAYEEALNVYQAVGVESNFVYVSMDLNELKQANDDLGHEAGDEILKGSAEIIDDTFASYGRTYRTGGDEFAALINVDADELPKLKEKFNHLMKGWRGQIVPSLNISCGFVAASEVEDNDIHKIAKLADSRMYQEKARYYASKGVDRRGQTEAFKVICTLFTKILKSNLTTDTYQVLRMQEDERSEDAGFSPSFFTWLHDFGASGQVIKDDLENYFAKTSPEFLKEYFLTGHQTLSIQYRRMYKGDFHHCSMEMVPASDYSHENQSVYLYVKILD